MSEVIVQLGQHTVAIELPHHLLSAGLLTSLKRDATFSGGDERIVVRDAGDRSYVLTGDGGLREAGLKRGDVLERLRACLATRLAEKAGVPILRAAAVKWGDGAVLLAGPEACGKSSLAAWFVEKGFALIADDQVAVVDDAGSVGGYPAPFTFAADAAAHLVGLAEFGTAPMARTAAQIHVGIKDSWRAGDDACPCGMIIFPRYVPDARARIEKLKTASAARLVKAQLQSPPLETDYWIVELARDTPAIALTYSDYRQIDGLLDRLVRLVIDEKLSPDALDRFVSGIGRSDPASTRRHPVPERSTRRFSPFMTIGMATYDDYDGVYFSLQAIRLYHPEILEEVEFLVIDNHPDGPCGAALKDLEKDVANLRYIPADDVTGTAVRDRVFSEAGGEFVLCMDCHVLLAPGSLRKLIDYFRTAPSSIDLIQGPMISNDLTKVSTHWSEGWRDGMFGQWAKDLGGLESDGQPFEIPLQGLGVFACRRRAWPGFNPAFRGFGGEEGYIHERFRQAGGRTLCMPSLRWLHRFGRPMGAPYPNKWEDRIRNYLIGFDEIGWDSAEMHNHFRELLGWQKADRIFATIRKELAVQSGDDKSPDSVRSDVIDDDEPYDLNEARLRFVAEVAVPILLDNFAFESVACIGRGSGIWAREFSRLGIASAHDEREGGPDARAADLVCCFEPPGVSSATQGKQLVLRLTSIAPVIVFAFARPEARGAIDTNRLRASWTTLFTRRGYRPVDCLRPALARDPRADDHYQRNLIVFSRNAAVPKARRASAVLAASGETGVSVIIPVYNGAAYLAQAIESVLLQTHGKFELIVVNNGSVDSSGAVAESYARVDKRVRVIHQENGGEAAAFNRGSAEARFALLARLDHDDVALPERLALQVAFMERNEDIAALGGSLRYIDREGKLTGKTASYPLTAEACHAALENATVGPIGNPAAMIRKAAFEQCGGLRRQFDVASDLDLWLRLDERFKLANLADALVDYRLHGDNSSMTRRFSLVLNAQIAKQSALLRRCGEPDPVNGWARLEFEHLRTFPMQDEEKTQTYCELFDAALKNFAATENTEYLRLADECLSWIPTASSV
ncbi:glycosyltransferase [Nordella sp. HKS 07]|uniref:glycosyltransferase n=1 Tax=Nordella sp. HKS 07 TaxID=2712222 RepID=UPI0013E10B31|nr:glycosyltransferase [Nordella sp. HKS 07]QIG48185.1 glycosyltransferase [Nordella sp. HKS 07]